MVIVMSSYENQIVKLLNREGIFFQREKTFEDLRGGKYRYDFYLQNVQGGPMIIEIDGEQHFKETNFFGNEKADTKAALIKYQLYDNIKNQYCITNNIPLIRIPYTHLKSISIEDLLLDTSKFIYKGENNE